MIQITTVEISIKCDVEHDGLEVLEITPNPVSITFEGLPESEQCTILSYLKYQQLEREREAKTDAAKPTLEARP